MILDDLANHARERVAIDKKSVSLDEMKQKALSMLVGDFRFEKALKNSSVGFICEVKKASPSKGIISADFPYLKTALEYEKIGATCMSVLTEPKWFLGSDKIFTEIRNQVSIPMLRKDFTIDPYQIYQAKVMGADAVLLICALLDTQTIIDYLEICKTLGLCALVETHNQEEIESALKANATILGVNNRNLKDFTVDLNNASNLRKLIPEDVIFVAESGIATPMDGIDLIKSGANALLIGEALMKTADKCNFLAEIKQGAQI